MLPSALDFQRANGNAAALETLVYAVEKCILATPTLEFALAVMEDDALMRAVFNATTLDKSSSLVTQMTGMRVCVALTLPQEPAAGVLFAKYADLLLPAILDSWKRIPNSA